MSTNSRRLRAPLLALLLVMAFAPGIGPGLSGSDAAQAATSDACGTLRAKPGGGTWACSFVDNFSGTNLDSDTWARADTATSGFTMNGSCFRSGQGVVQAGGLLRLSVVRQAVSCQSPYGTTTMPYVGGGVSTFGKYSQTYGRFEVRMKFPAYRGTGLHGGFWMNPQTRDYGIWPGSGEIDVAEWLSATPDNVYPSLHYTGSTGLTDTAWHCTISRVDLFHTYAAEWSPDGIDFLYDGQLCFSRQWTPINLAAPAPFDRPFTLSLVAASGGFGNEPTLSTPNPAYTYIDYVKAWR